MSKAQQWLLDLLHDGEPHSSEEIRMKSGLALGNPITVHSRVTDLREMGYKIPSKKVKGVYWFMLEGHEEPKPKAPPVVQHYLFQTVEGDPRNGNMCKILARASSDAEQLVYGPAFLVRFGDDSEDVASWSELHPHYPT